MPPIITSTEVERPAEDVFAYATDPTRFHEWQQGVVNGRMDQPGAPSIRARCQTTRRIGGANRASTCEVVRITPPTTWGVQDIDRPIRAIVDVTVEPSAAHRSRLSIAVDFEGHGIGKLLVPLVVRARHARRCRPTWRP
jgi:uncharacterized protein YndB with AHSA1/START domain